MFAPNSFWNQRLPADAPIDPTSAAIVANVVKQVKELGPGFSFADHGVPVFYASADCPTQKVTIDKKNQSGEIAEGLKKMFAAVPIPPEARPVGPWFGDNHMVIYQRSTDTLWGAQRWSQFEVDGPHVDSETEGLSEEITHAPGWHIEEGVCITNVSQNPGYFTGFPEVPATHAYAERASGLPLPGGAIFPAEAQRLYIPHALAISMVTIYNQPRWPAQRTDGASSDATMPAEGMLLKLPANVDLSGVKDPFAKALNVAIRDFGFRVCDKSGNPTIKCVCEATKRGEHGYGTDAWKGPSGAFGSAGAILSGNKSIAEEILWSQLEVVAESYRPNEATPGLLPKGA